MLPLMTFLNASLLFGAAAFAIPLIIHLLNRSRFKSLDWGAMMFLEDALRANSRRLEWQKWLLLLLRCAIPICLALCMARPLLQSSLMTPMLAGGQTSVTCLLIDNSLSMDAKVNAAAGKPETSFDDAKSQAKEIIQSANRNSRWSIDPIGTTETNPVEISSRDLYRQNVFIDAMPHGTGGAGILESMEQALAKLAKTSESQRRIVLISDFQKSMCQDIEPSKVTALRQRCEAMPNPPTLIFLPVNYSDNIQKTKSNLALHIDSQTQSLIGVGQAWEVRFVVKNFGSDVASNAKLILSVDGTPTSSKTLDVPSQAETQVTFGMVFPDAGSHRIEANLEANESLLADNHAAWSVLVLRAVPVLVVDPLLYDKKRTPESEFVQAALDPFADSLDNNASLFRVSRISPEELKPDSFASHKIVVMANVAKLKDSVVEPLIQFIRAGGILLIFAGDRIDSEWYNTHLGSTSMKSSGAGSVASKQLFLPMLYDRQPTLLKSDETGMKLRRDNFQHPAIRFLNDVRTSSLDNIEVQGWYRLLPTADDGQQNVAGLLSLVNGDYFLAERVVGEGTVLQCATTCNDRWTNWPLRPIYLPMLQQLLLNTTPAARWPINVETGQQLNVPSNQLLNWLEKMATESSPGGARTKRNDESKDLQSESGTMSTVWHFPNTVQATSTSVVANYPGVYEIKGISDSTLYLSAQAPLKESDLELESEDGLKSLADRLGAQIVRSTDSLNSLDRRGNHELWRWFLIGLLALLFGELFLQRRFSGAAA